MSEPDRFPPDTIEEFLACCAGDWLALRSLFELAGPDGDPAEGENGDEWHSSERGELRIVYLPPEQPGEPGSLAVTPPVQEEGAGRGSQVVAQHLIFSASGDFHSDPSQGGVAQGDASQGSRGGAEGCLRGTWQLWPDGSLELTSEGPAGVVRERIWFTKPNLRLRSSVEHRHDGSPGRASFSSEIRRVRR